MESLQTPSHLNLSKSRLLRFRSLISCKGAELGHMLPLDTTGKPYIESPMTSYMTLSGFERAKSHLTFSDLERSKSRSLRFQSIIFRKEQSWGPYVTIKR